MLHFSLSALRVHFFLFTYYSWEEEDNRADSAASSTSSFAALLSQKGKAVIPPISSFHQKIP